MYLIDTNIIIYHLANQAPATHFLQQHRGQLAISTITMIEVLSYDFDSEQRKIVEKFLKEHFIWLELSHEIAFKTADIRQIKINGKIKKIKTPDAIIAASAIFHSCQLVTANEKDFSHLPIKIINPMSINL